MCHFMYYDGMILREDKSLKRVLCPALFETFGLEIFSVFNQKHVKDV